MQERRPSLLREFLRARRWNAGPSPRLLVDCDETESSPSELTMRPWRQCLEWSRTCGGPVD